MFAIENLKEKIIELDTIDKIGAVKNVTNELVESNGPICEINELGELVRNHGKNILMELVGFNKDTMKFMPYQSISGIKKGEWIRGLHHPLKINVSEKLKGRIINAIGEPIDDKGKITGVKKSIFTKAPDVLKRELINEKLVTGIKSIDSFLTIGKGQRIGIFSGPGVGKSILLSMIAKYSQADINVIAIIGERGREVKEFVESHLSEEGRRKSIMVVSTSDETALSRIRSLYTATTIAEHFRDQGKNVLLMVDSITRVGLAQRELSISLKEPPITRGYPPSLFTLLPQLLERVGKNGKGSITAFYTVLTEGDDLDDPISDAMRGLLDGHIILSRKLAEKTHYPSIDIKQSISRLMINVTDKKHQDIANKIKEILSIYYENEDLIQVGAYIKGSNAKLDIAIQKKEVIDKFLQQDFRESFTFEDSLEKLNAIL